MRLMPARTAVCTAADIECDLPVPRPPRNNQHHDRSGGGSCASRAAKTQSSAASSPSPRISSSASAGVISLMSRRNWCMRLTSRKKRSAIVVVLFHDFAFDVAIFLASYILSTSARIFLAVSDTVLAAAAEHERHMIGEPRSNASAPPPRASSVGRISSLTGRSYRFVRAVSSLSPPLPFPLLRTNVISSGCWGRDDHGWSTWAKCSCSRLSSVCDELLASVIESVHGARSRPPPG